MTAALDTAALSAPQPADDYALAHETAEESEAAEWALVEERPVVVFRTDDIDFDVLF